jgi:hypothetical protein
MTLQLPDDVPPEVRELGEPIAEFRSGAFAYVLLLVIGCFAILLGVGFLILCIGILIMPAWVNQGGRLPNLRVLLVTFICVSAGIATLRRARALRGLHVLVFPTGLARVQGRQSNVLRWDDINRVTRNPSVKAKGLTVSTPSELILLSRDGWQIVFNESLSRLRELRALVEEYTLKTMLPLALEALEAGETIGFGPVSVSAEGVHYGQQTLPWDGYQSAEIAKGTLLVKATDTRGFFCKEPLAEIPNVHVFIALAARMAGKQS